jgi:hypothetical protein
MVRKGRIWTVAGRYRQIWTDVVKRGRICIKCGHNLKNEEIQYVTEFITEIYRQNSLRFVLDDILLLQKNKIGKENSKGTINHCARDLAESEICPGSAEPGNFILFLLC